MEEWNQNTVCAIYVILRPWHIWPAGMEDILNVENISGLIPQAFWIWSNSFDLEELNTEKYSKSGSTETLSTHSGRLAPTGMAKYQRLLHPCEIFRKLAVKLHLNMS